MVVIGVINQRDPKRSVLVGSVGSKRGEILIAVYCTPVGRLLRYGSKTCQRPIQSSNLGKQIGSFIYLFIL
jgi:hypothetical protein